MIFQTDKLPEWTSDQALELRTFLQSSTGRAAITHVLSERPVLLDGSDVNRTLVANGDVRGFVLAIESLFRLTWEQPSQEPASSEYPPLDDDKAWEEKPTTEPPTPNG